MGKIADVILLGSLSIDRIMNFGGSYKDVIAPDKIHVLSLSVLVDRLNHSRGGVAANIAYNLALLQDPSVLLTSVGMDGRSYVEDLGNLGVDTSHVHFSELPTSTFTVLTDSSDNQVGGFYPGSMSDSDSLNLDSWTGEETISVVSAYDPATMKRFVREANSRNFRIVYDVGQQVSNVPAEDLKEGIDKASVIILNDYELGVLSRRSGFTEEEIIKRVPLVVTTLGCQGSKIEGKDIGQPIHIGAVKDIDCVDPTGAGDAYRSGFLYGYRRGWTPELCARLGSVIASYAIEKSGTQEHTFTTSQICKRYQETYGEELCL